MCSRRINFTQLSKRIAHALRHEPWLYELEIDGEGWTSIQQLLDSLRDVNKAWECLTQADLETMIAGSDKERYEIGGDRIRALYGHSFPWKLQKIKAEPPDILYHGTTRTAADQILTGGGLKPMSRQYVHMSVDTETAEKVGLRRSREIVILVVDARRAHSDGIDFYIGNQHVWLADNVPEIYLSIR